MALAILYPNGQVEAVQMFIWVGGQPQLWDGSITVSTTGSAIEDGSNPTIKATVFNLTNSNPLATQIVDANGDAITSFGGGTQYTDAAAAPTHPIGNSLVFATGGNWQYVNSTNGLPVNVLNSSLAVTGPLTDTQLRASAVPISATALPLPALAATSTKQSDGSQKTQIVDGSGNVIGATSNALDINIKSGNPTTIAVTNAGTFAVQDAAAEASLSVLDDWDESDRAKVNIIAGQAGITAGAGAVAANTPRTTLASDDPAVAVLGATTGAKVITDANGTIQQYLRGLIYLFITSGQALVTAAIAAGSNLIGYVGQKNTYGSLTTLTTTNWSNLASGSGWQSDSITTSGARGIIFNMKTKGAAGSTGLADFYLAELPTSGSYTDGATGTEGTFTAANRKNSYYIGSIQLNTTNSVVGPLRVVMPDGILAQTVALIGINNSGGTISSTGGDTVFAYQLVN